MRVEIKIPGSFFLYRVRARRIELRSTAWEAVILPLNHARIFEFI